MFLSQLILLLLAIVNLNYVQSFSEDVIQLREHFIANLLEENREKMHENLTNEIQEAINQKIQAFLMIINEPAERKKRDSNDLLLHEKTKDIEVLKGFKGRGEVPINFPQDICMFRINGKSIAAGLSHLKSKGNTLTIFRRANMAFHKVHEFHSKYLTKIDCATTGSVGYIAVVNSKSSTINTDEIPASFIYRLTMDDRDELHIESMQVFPEPNQINVKMWSREKELFLIYTYNSDGTPKTDKCPIYRLEAENFAIIDYLPCQNSRIVEFFSIGQEVFVFLGNYPESNLTTITFSTLMRYEPSNGKFRTYQKLYSNAITVGKYFSFEFNGQQQHFLFIGNSYEINEQGMINYEVSSTVYKLVNGYFVPLQAIKVSHARDVAPIVGKSDFHLLITSEDTEVQIYYYDGWRFQESTLDFTGESFGAGVTSMRVYNDIIEDTTTLVISNINVNVDNVYTPIYVTKKDSAKIKDNILKWCNEAHERVEEFDVNKSEEKLKSAYNLTSSESDEVHFMNELNLKNTTIGAVHTNNFKFRNIVVDARNVNRLNSMRRRKESMRKDIDILRQKIQFTEATRRVRRQAESNALIKKLELDGPLNVVTINGKPISNLVYSKNSKNQRMKSLTAKEILIKKELFVEGKIDGIEMAEDNLILNVPQQVLRPMKIKSLAVRNINPTNVNGMSFNDFFTLLKRKVDPKIPNLIHELDVETIDIALLLNGKNFTSIAMDSMKSSGEQTLKAPLTVKSLKVNALNFDRSPEAISKMPINNLININDPKSIEIFQDIRFEKPLEVNQLFVNDRINNIKVKEGKLQILRTFGPEEQTVTGEKIFENVNLKGPIVLRGKIESKSLERMNPVITIDKNLVLQGDFIIKGPVTVERLMNVTGDVTSRNPQLTLAKLATSGLHLANSNSAQSKMIFKDLLQVRGNLRASSINNVPVDSFVKLDVNQEQVVKGRKVFKKNLLVKGKIEADLVNEVDLKQLDETVLKKISNGTQFIDGNVQLANLQVDRISTRTAKLNEKDVNLILSRNRPQTLKELKLPAVKAKSLNASNVIHKLGAKVFGTDLNFLIDDSLTKDSLIDGIVAEKKFSILKVENLKFSEGNEWKGIIGNFENILKGFEINSNTVLDQVMSVRNLIVKGKINGIAHEDMLNKWLRLEGDQAFTAPQKFKKFKAEKNLHVEEINGKSANDLIESSIYIDQPLNLDNLQINGLLAVASKIQAPLINGATFNDKLILNNTENYQEIKRLVVTGGAGVQHLNYNSLNGINLKDFLHVFNGFDDAPINLKIIGKATFTQPANISFLNYANVQELFNNVWLANREVNLVGESIKFDGDVKIEKDFYADSLNSRILDELSSHYLSKSREQTIGGNFNIIGNVFALKNFFATKTIVPKFLKINDHTLFNITEFAHNIIRNDVNQEVHGDWKIRKLVLYGDYSGLINGLELPYDVLHAGNPMAQIGGVKKIRSLYVHDIEVQYINEIDVDDWIRNAVRIYSNKDQYINGHVHFKKPVQFESNLHTYSTLNGKRIDRGTVLMKNRGNEPQVIAGDVTFFIIDPRSQIVRMPNQLMIDHLTLHGDINGRNWAELNENVFRSDSDFIDSKVVFDKELRVNELETNNSIYGIDMVEFLRGNSVSNNMLKFKKNMEHLSEVGDDVIRSLGDSVIELSHFEFVQTLTGNDIRKSILFSNGNNHFLAVHEKNSSMEIINFFKWNRESKKFFPAQKPHSLLYATNDYHIVHFNKILYGGVNHLYLEIFDSRKVFTQLLLAFDSVLGHFRHVIETTSQVPAKIFTWMDGSMKCYGLTYKMTDKVYINCEGTPQTIIQIEEPISEISSLSDALIILTANGNVKVWHNHLTSTVLGINNPQSFSAIRYNDKYYLAIRTDEIEGTIHHGDVHIFESPVGEINFKELQKLPLHVPTAIQFSKAPSGDLLLYVLTRNEPRAFYVFSYAGSSNFVSSIGEDTIIKKASELDFTQIDGKTELVSVVSGENLYIIQAVLNEF